MSNFYGIPSEPIEYYDTEIKDVHYCKKCDNIIPLSKKDIGLCDECDDSIEKLSLKTSRRKFISM